MEGQLSILYNYRAMEGQPDIWRVADRAIEGHIMCVQQ